MYSLLCPCELYGRVHVLWFQCDLLHGAHPASSPDGQTFWWWQILCGHGPATASMWVTPLFSSARASKLERLPPPCLPADVVQSAFYNLSSASSAAELQELVDVYFDKPGSEFELWTPPDWREKWDDLWEDSWTLPLQQSDCFYYYKTGQSSWQGYLIKSCASGPKRCIKPGSLCPERWLIYDRI